MSMRDFRSTSQQDQEKVEAKERRKSKRKKTPCHKSKAAPCSTVIYDRGASDAKKNPERLFFLFLFLSTNGDAICDLLYVACMNGPPLLPFPPLLPSDFVLARKRRASLGWGGI